MDKQVMVLIFDGVDAETAQDIHSEAFSNITWEDYGESILLETDVLTKEGINKLNQYVLGKEKPEINQNVFSLMVNHGEYIYGHYASRKEAVKVAMDQILERYEDKEDRQRVIDAFESAEVDGELDEELDSYGYHIYG